MISSTIPGACHQGYSSPLIPLWLMPQHLCVLGLTQFAGHVLEDFHGYDGGMVQKGSGPMAQ